MDLLNPPSADAFTVGWVSALGSELAAATAMLDMVYSSPPNKAQYTLGAIGEHNVVLAGLPAGQIGTTSATIVAVEMKSLFPRIQIGLMVGVGAGVPGTGADIRLGDVVISQPHGRYGGVVQYDYGKTGPSGDSMITGYLNAPPAPLLTAVTNLKASLSTGTSRISENLSLLTLRPEFSRTNAGADVLYHASYPHSGGPTCRNCDKNMTIQRTRRDREEIVIHYGTIASGNQVMKDGLTRDSISAKLGGVLCFEMEAAGLMNTLPCLVVRGICDYADSHKNKNWQPFAAAAAAACAKEILSKVPAMGDSRSRPPKMKNEPTVKRDTRKVYARLAMTVQERLEYLEHLTFDQMDARHATIVEAHADTCRWLLNSSKYRDWLDGRKIPNHEGFLWIKGKPGTGKSTLMKFAYADARRTMTDSTVISFFFNARGDTLEKTTIGMYRSLLCQLLTHHQELQAVLDPLASRYTISYVNEIQTIKGLFRHAVEMLGEQSLTCFVDALDECNEELVREMITFFEQIGTLRARHNLPFRVCFSSRHYPQIVIRRGLQLVLEEQRGHDRDIFNYLHSELRADSTPLVETIKDQILLRASGIFLWVVLVVKILNKEYAHGRMHALKRRLAEIPDGLDELFRDTLSRDRENEKELVVCFQWLLFATRPLSPQELRIAIILGAEPESIDDSGPEGITMGDTTRFILSCSKGLAFITTSRNPTVQFVHESVRDYLLSGRDLRWIRFFPSSNLHGSSQEKLKQCCLEYMRFAFSSIDTSSLKPSGSMYIERSMAAKFPLLKYAVQNVLYHSDAAASYGCAQRQFIIEFPLDHWTLLHNFFAEDQQAWFSADVSLLYILAAQNLSCLIPVELERVPHMDILGGVYRYPLFVAIILAREHAVTALLKPLAVFETSSIHPDEQSVVKDVIKNNRRYLLHGEQTLLPQAANRGDTALIKVLLRTGKVDTEQTNRFGQTMLSCIAEKDQAEAIKFVLSCNRDLQCQVSSEDAGLIRPNARDKHGRTCLFWAVLSGREGALKELLAIPEIDVNSSDNEGQAPLHAAATWGYMPAAKALLSRPDIKPDLKDNLGQTPLSWAAKKGHMALINLLLTRSDVDVNSRDLIGRTPLCLAAREGQNSVVALLIGHPGVALDARDAFNQTPLNNAAGRGHQEVVKLLTQAQKA